MIAPAGVSTHFTARVAKTVQSYSSQDDQVGIDASFSDSDLVPETEQNRLMNLRDMMTACSWGIGDIANDLIEQNAAAGLQVTAKRIYKAVGRFCGRSGRTVRYYAETASFYPLEVREEYEVLSFAHFVFARQMKEKWREVLDCASSSPGATVDQLEKEYLPCQSDDTGEPGDAEQSREVSQIIDAISASLAGASETVEWPASFIMADRPGIKHGLISAASSLMSALSEYQSRSHELLADKDRYSTTLSQSDGLVKEMRSIAKRVAQIASTIE